MLETLFILVQNALEVSIKIWSSSVHASVRLPNILCGQNSESNPRVDFVKMGGLINW